MGGADDSTLAHVCHRETRVLITLDVGFGDIRQYPPQTTLGSSCCVSAGRTGHGFFPSARAWSRP